MKGMVAAIVVVALIVGAWYFTSHTAEAPEVGDRTEKSTDGKPVIPLQAIYKNASADLIVVDFPLPGAVVGNAFTVAGRARGQWYFEADFPIEVRSPHGDTILMLATPAQGEWMTTEFVPFLVSLKVPADFKGPATLILRNHNASGLPEHERSLSIPITIE